MEREMSVDVYVRPLRREEKLGGRFQRDTVICCEDDGTPIGTFSSELEARWAMQKRGYVPHTVH